MNSRNDSERARLARKEIIDYDWLETARGLDRGRCNKRMLAIARDIFPMA